jgi:predicted metal-dependent HD superfamily phosphohydrolase
MKTHVGSCRKQVNQEIKRQYWKPIEGRYKSGAWEALDAAYTEPHRAYHTWGHVAGLLERLNELSDLSTRRDIIAMSIIWHDAVYKTQNQDGNLRSDYENVRDSAELFRRFSLLNQPDGDAVYDLIMATANHLEARAGKQHYAGFAGDLDLFMDLDLSSLALPWDEFSEDFARIRFEFSWIPEVAFCSRQIQILENFAKEDVRLYRRAETRERWRDAARSNLTRCVTEMKQAIATLSKP